MILQKILEKLKDSTDKAIIKRAKLEQRIKKLEKKSQIILANNREGQEALSIIFFLFKHSTELYKCHLHLYH